jgi:hypothetical protein
LGSNIPVRIVYSNIFSPDSSLNVRDHVSQPYSTTLGLPTKILKALLPSYTYVLHILYMCVYVYAREQMLIEYLL